MGSLERRLEQLESRSVSKRGPYGEGMNRRGLQRYFHAYENARRESHGLDPLPPRPGSGYGPSSCIYISPAEQFSPSSSRLPPSRARPPDPSS